MSGRHSSRVTRNDGVGYFHLGDASTAAAAANVRSKSDGKRKAPPPPDTGTAAMRGRHGGRRGAPPTTGYDVVCQWFGCTMLYFADVTGEYARATLPMHAHSPSMLLMRVLHDACCVLQCSGNCWIYAALAAIGGWPWLIGCMSIVLVKELTENPYDTERLRRQTQATVKKKEEIAAVLSCGARCFVSFPTWGECGEPDPAESELEIADFLRKQVRSVCVRCPSAFDLTFVRLPCFRCSRRAQRAGTSASLHPVLQV